MSNIEGIVDAAAICVTAEGELDNQLNYLAELEEFIEEGYSFLAGRNLEAQHFAAVRDYIEQVRQGIGTTHILWHDLSVVLMSLQGGS